MNAGQAVKNSEGQIGIVTDPARKSGGSKGQVGVMFIGAPYPVLVAPADLTPVTIGAGPLCCVEAAGAV